MKNMEHLETNHEGHQVRSGNQVNDTSLSFIESTEAETVSTEKWIDFTLAFPKKTLSRMQYLSISESWTTK